MCFHLTSFWQASCAIWLQGTLSRRTAVCQDDLPLLASLQVKPCYCLLTLLKYKPHHLLRISPLSVLLATNPLPNCHCCSPQLRCTANESKQKWLVQGLQLQANADIIPLTGPNTMAGIIRTIQYLPQALQYVAHHCKHLEELSLRLSQAASSRRGGAWDHPSLLKRPHFKLSQFWSHCTSLQSLTLVNVPSRYGWLYAVDVDPYGAMHWCIWCHALRV